MLKLRKPSQHRPRRSSSVTARSLVSYPSLDDLYEEGKSLRKKCPRKSHAVWKPPHDRPDPVRLLQESNRGRIPQLIPIRHGRMMQTPFTFYRGAALNMAADLATTPERREIFDINDLDETLPAPWEWDVKRLAASFVLACRNNGFSEDCARDAVLSCVRSYRERMAEFSEMRVLDVWYARMDIADLIPTIKDAQTRKRFQKRLKAARNRSVLEHDFPKLAEVVGRLPTIKDNPPLIYHWRKHGHGEFFAGVKTAFARYRETMQEDRRRLLDRYELHDIAIKVVGVGSVGTWCRILLLLASEQDPLFLQVKEARSSVLEAYAGKSIYANHGQRVVNGYRLM